MMPNIPIIDHKLQHELTACYVSLAVKLEEEIKSRLLNIMLRYEDYARAAHYESKDIQDHLYSTYYSDTEQKEWEELATTEDILDFAVAQFYRDGREYKSLIDSGALVTRELMQRMERMANSLETMLRYFDIKVSDGRSLKRR